MPANTPNPITFADSPVTRLISHTVYLSTNHLWKFSGRSTHVNGTIQAYPKMYELKASLTEERPKKPLHNRYLVVSITQYLYSPCCDKLTCHDNESMTESFTTLLSPLSVTRVFFAQGATFYPSS